MLPSILFASAVSRLTSKHTVEVEDGDERKLKRNLIRFCKRDGGGDARALLSRVNVVLLRHVLAETSGEDSIEMPE
jgi:hypothetical protein